MKWRDLLQVVSSEPTFSSSLLLAGDVSKGRIQKQLSRWSASGKLVQLRRGLYSVAPPYSNTTPHPFLIANRLKPASYVSLQSALAYHGIIPEHVPVVTSVTTGRPGKVTNPLGTFIFRHIKPSLLHGFVQIEAAPGQFAVVATSEKSLLDLVYLTPRGDSRAYLEELRLANLDTLDLDWLRETAVNSQSAKLKRVVRHLADLADAEEIEIL